ncbi:MAG: ThuA domain-containing protein, partial [bacterium]|nr:ThuA domain-containing protein [bacterium]
MKWAVMAAIGLVVGVCMSAQAEPLKVVFVSGSFEYNSDANLSVFKTYLEANYDAKVTFVSANGSWTDLPGLDALEDCDTALFFTRRLKIEGEQLQRVKDYCLAGNPVVGVRTASHGFQNWLEMDKEILGGNYHNHYGNGPTTKCTVPNSVKNHPVLEGVGPIATRNSLYKNKPITDDTTILMNGHTPDAVEPVTWVREHKGARIFYTSLGGRGDYENDSIKRLLANALFWSAGRTAEPKPQPEPKRREKPEGTLDLTVRTRVETPPDSGEWKETIAEKQLPIAETAVIICDM